MLLAAALLFPSIVCTLATDTRNSLDFEFWISTLRFTLFKIKMDAGILSLPSSDSRSLTLLSVNIVWEKQDFRP